MTAKAVYPTELVDTALELISEGHSLKSVADAMGLSIGQAYRAVTSTQELAMRYATARLAAADILETQMMEVINASTPQSSQADRVKLQGLQWLLSKRCPARYADRLEQVLSNPDGSLASKPTVIQLVAPPQ